MADELPFISDNPAVAAYQAGQKFNREQEAADLANKSAQQKLDFDTSANPSKLRSITAGADLAETTAGTAAQTQPFVVSQARSSASLAGTNADLASRTEGSKIQEADAGARTATANAGVAEGTAPSKISEAQSGARLKQADADVAVQTVPTKVEGAGVGLRQQKAAATNLEMQGYYKSFELANEGRFDEAQEVSRQTGHGTIPQEIIDNADLRLAISNINKRAQELYPNNPRLQQTFIHAAVTDMGQRRQQGQRASDPTAPYSVPGAPTPPETGGAGNYEVVNRQETDENGRPVVNSYRFDKRTGAMIKLEGNGAVLSRNAAGAAGSGLTPEAIDGAAERVLNGDPRALQGYGRNQAALTAINNRTYELARERGMNMEQMGARTAAFAGQMAAMRTLGVRGASVEYASNTANRAIDIAQETMAKVPRGSFLPFNKLMQVIDTNRGSPEQAAAFAATNTLVNEYARVVSPTGAPTEGTREHAREMLNTAQSHEAYNAVLTMMRREIASAKAAFDQTQQEFLQRGGNQGGGTPGGPPPAQPAPPRQDFNSRFSGAPPGAQPAPGQQDAIDIPPNLTPEQVKAKYPSGTKIRLPDGRVGTVP